MLQGQAIRDVVQLLQQRKAKLYHACQLIDFQSYLRLGGIPSRALMEAGGLPYTNFDTDDSDHTNGVWDKVFGNFSDFGMTFAKGNVAIPNVYGPILLQIKPDAFLEATDLAICLRSAGGKGFNRETESLASVEDVDRLFKHPQNDDRASWIKFRNELQQEFSMPEASAPEFSCTVVSGKFPLEYVEFARVDSYVIGGKALCDQVEQLKTENRQNFPIYSRGDRCPSYTNELVEILANSNSTPSLSNLCQSPDVSSDLKIWAKAVMDRNLEYQFNRFARYLVNGTIKPMLESL